MNGETTYKIIDNIELLEDYGIYLESEAELICDNTFFYFIEVVLPECRLN